MRYLRQPQSRQSRIGRLPVAAFLIAGGAFSFLPVLGLWMLPLGDVRRNAGVHATVDFGLLDPLIEGLRRAANLHGN